MWGLVDIAVCRLQTAAAAPDGDKNTIESTWISGGAPVQFDCCSNVNDVYRVGFRFGREIPRAAGSYRVRRSVSRGGAPKTRKRPRPRIRRAITI